MSTKTEPSISTVSRYNAKSKIISPLIMALFVSAILLTGIIAMIFGHKFGYQRGLKIAQENTLVENNNNTASSTEIEALNLKVNMLNDQLNTAHQERDISLSNLGVMRMDIQDLKLENLQLKQLNDVYEQRLVKRGGLPLQIVGAKIEPLPENAFEYRFDVAMLATDGREHRLTPKLTLLTEESLVEVPLEPSRYDIKGISRIRGRFVMPDDFTPEQARLELSSSGAKIEQIYDWKKESVVDKMPISLAEVPETDQRPITEDD